jgi:DNA repair protein RadD
MSNLNIYERLPIFRLQEIIGVTQLETVQNILEIINSETFSSSLIFTKSFLASYAKSNLNIKFLFSYEGLDELINTLSDIEIRELAGQLNVLDGLSTKEDFIRLSKVLIKNKESRRVIATFMGLGEFINYDGDAIQLPASIDFNAASKPYKPLKDYQFEVYFQANKKLENRNSRFILQMPTGSGKTRTAIEIVCEFLNNHPDGSVVWLAHSTELCDQASECFSEIWPHLAKRDLYFHRHYGTYKLQPIADKKIGFLCSSFQSLLSRVEKNPESLNGFLGKNRLIIVDEAHKVVAPTYNKVTRALLNDDAAVVGLTATPGRSYGTLNTDIENEELSNFFFNTHISFNPHGQTAIEYLRSKGVLADARLESLMISNESINLSKKELDYVSRMFELPPEMLVKLGKSHLRNAEILSKLTDLIKRQGCMSTIFFATSLEQSKLICSLLNFMGVKSAHIDGDTPSLVRQESIRQFKSQKINVLCNYEVLSTGFDAPLVDCVFIARPTASVVLYSQMIGRGLRGPAIGGKAKCLIVNVRDNIVNLPSIDAMYRIFDDYWIRD